MAGDYGQLHALAFEVAQRAHVGVVLHRACDDAVARFEQSIKRQVEGVSGIGGEDDPQWVRDIEQAGSFLACLVDDTRRRD